MLLHIAICDDDAAQTDYLRALADRWAQAHGHRAALRTYPSAEAFWFDYAQDKRCDILLLDIQMRDMDGLSLARRVRADSQRLQILFITGYPDFMAEGYEVSALHYLLKPVSEEKLAEVLNRAVTRLQAAPRTVLLPGRDGPVRLPADDILYAEAFPHHCTVVTLQGALDFSLRFSALAELLGEGFFRCHRSYIVHLAHVRRVTRRAMVLDTQAEIPLARAQYDAANQAFIRYA